MTEQPPTSNDGTLSVLMLEDSPLDADLIQAMLLRSGLRTAVSVADTEAAYLAALAERTPDLILSDYALPDYDGLRALDAARRLAPDVPFIFVSGTMGEEIAIDCLKLGATDYVLKQRLERLVPSVRRAVAESRERAERRKVEAALRASEERLRLALDAGRLGCWELDFETGVVECDGLFRANLGLPPDAAVTESALIGLIHPNDRDRVAGALARAADGAGVFDAEFRAVPPDRRVRWAAARGRADRARRRLRGVALDLTERREAEDALKLSEEQFRRALEDAPVPVIMLAEDGQVLQVSKTWAVLTGYAPEDRPTFDTWLEAAYGTGGDRVRDAVHELFVGEVGIAAVDFDIVTRSGDRRTWSFSASSPGVLRDGRRFVVGMALDVTDRKRAEEALRQADQRKDEFLATLAHELRNPLAPLRNAVQILKLAGDDPQHTEFAHGLIERQVAQLVRLVDDLLDVSRITRDKIELRKKPTPLAEVVSMAVENSRSAIAGAGHELTVTLPPDEVVLDADPARLAQVLTNLLNNAAKYTPSGGQVSLTAAAAAGTVAVKVADTGIGLADGDAARIFEPFAQAGRVDGRAADGLGVGLALVKRLTELHGGTVTAASDGPGQGSTFTVTLPLRIAECGMRNEDKMETDSGLPALHSAIRNPHSAMKRVLVVDDVADSGSSLGEVLRLLGMAVRVVPDGPSALAAAREFRPDVALIDLGMPGMDGLEVARRWRADPGLAAAPLVAVTGHGTAADRERSRAAGYVAHLVKPVEIDQLRRVLAQVSGRPASEG